MRNKTFVPLILAIVFIMCLHPGHVTAALYSGYSNWGIIDTSTSWLEVVTITDLTNDDRLDIALTSAASFAAEDAESLYLLPQTPEGNLGTALVHPAGLRPVAMASGDLNGSGRNDLVVIFGGQNTLNVYAQTESGALAAPVQHVTGAEPQSVVVGDFDTDGRDDVLVAHAEAQYISLYLQTDSGTLAAPITYTIESAGFVQLTVGDLDGDGADDVALLRGSGFGTGQVAFFTQQNGTLVGPFTRTVSAGDLGAHAIAVGDVTGDGRDDIVVVAGGLAPMAYLNILVQSSSGEIAETPVVYATPGLPSAVAIGDIDHDGYNDVIIAHATQETLSIYRQDGLGAFLPYESFPLPYSDYYNPHGLALGDLNGDGGLDTALADYSNGLILLYNEVGAPSAAINTPHRFAYATQHGAYTFSGSVSGAEQVQISLDGGQNWIDTTVASGSWTITSTLSSDGVYRIKVRAVDVTGKVQSPPAVARVVVDTVAPTSQVHDLAEYQTETTFLVTWSGNDNVSGIAHYDLQVREGDGAWTDWLTQTTALSATFGGQDGHTYTIRSRATDGVGNVEAWPDTAEAETTIDVSAPTSAVTPLPPYQTTLTFTVTWAGADNVSGIAHYDIQVRAGADGVWTDWLTQTTAISATFSGQDGQTYAFRSRATDNAGNIEAWPDAMEAETTVDVSAPTSIVATLSPYQTALTFTVAWSGADGVSGIAHYDIQVRDGEGPWTDWLTQTTALSATFTGQDGQTYAFRSRATGNAGDVEAWPDTAEAETTIDISTPTSAVDALPPYQTALTFTVAWAGADSISGIAHYDIQVHVGADGEWIDWLTQTMALSATFSGHDGQTYAFRSRATDNAGNVEAWPATPETETTVDTLPPISSVETLALYQTDSVFMVQWTGTDTGSGILSYDIQVNDNASETWNDWLTNSVTTSAVFTGELNHTYCFRSSAVDKVGNWEQYVEGNGDTCTTVTEHGLQVVPQSLSKKGNLGETVTFTHSLTNTSLVSDTFICKITSLLGWTSMQTYSVSLAAEQSIDVHFTTTVPTKVLAYTVEQMTLEVFSLSKTEVSQRLTDTLTVNHVSGIESTVGQVYFAELGEVLTYTHIITNTGNYTDTYTVTVVSDWSQLLTPDTITVAPWEDVKIILRVEVPIGLKESLDHQVLSTVSSITDSNAKAVISDTIQVAVMDRPLNWVYLPLVLRK